MDDTQPKDTADVLASFRARREARRRAWRTNYIPGGAHTFYPFELLARQATSEEGPQIVAVQGNKCVVRASMKTLDFAQPGPPYPEKLENWLCGYVILKDRQIHRNWKGNYDADAPQYLNIHGGLTYAEWHGYLNVFGFDCHHAGDENNPAMHNPLHVLQLACVMEQQLLDFAKVRREWKQAGRRRRAKMVDAIRGRATMSGGLGLGAMLGMLAGAPEFDNARVDRARSRRSNDDANLQPKPA